MDVNNEDIEKVEPGELLEDIWFFGNLLQRKSRMLRSLSDPCTSSSSSSSKVYGGQEEASPEKSYEETYESIKKLSAGDEPPRRSLIRAPSDPSSSVRKDQKPAKKGSDSLRGKSSNRRRAPAKALNRAPSLPTSLQETDEEENEFSMGKLIRQASMNYSDTLPPRKHAAKALTPSSSVPSSSVSRYRSTRKKSEVEGIKFDMESEELLRGFNDLRLDSGGKDSSPNPISIAPGLQERKRVDEEEDEVVKHSRAMRPYLSEAWAAAPKQSSAPPFPKWGGGGKAKRSNEDVKAQIKFWARAVASNVRQEC